MISVSTILETAEIELEISHPLTTKALDRDGQAEYLASQFDFQDGRAPLFEHESVVGESASFRSSKRTVMVGERFGRLLVIGLAPSKHRNSYRECRCDCGNVRIIPASGLTAGRSRSCGCLKVEQSKTHGLSHIPEYLVWKSMKARCLSPAASGYRNYGGRGIALCGRWLSFEKFIEDMGRRPGDEYSIERINNDGNYEPSNCRWATKREQANNRRGNRLLTLKGKTLTLQQWADSLGISAGTLDTRLRLGWTLERALLEPVASQRVCLVLAGDSARFERSCGSFCEGCPVCEDEL